MKFFIAQTLARRPSSGAPERVLLVKYVERAAKYLPCVLKSFASEASLLGDLDRSKVRTPVFLVLADSEGRNFSSAEFAAELGRVRDGGVQQVLFAVGPADGWSGEALRRADLKVSFGKITLPHELAAVVLAEQIYRALTILAGHPYHTGH